MTLKFGFPTPVRDFSIDIDTRYGVDFDDDDSELDTTVPLCRLVVATPKVSLLSLTALGTPPLPPALTVLA